MDSALITLHLFGIIFFVGGQMAMISAVSPTLRGREGGEEAARVIATRFGIGSAVALLVIIGSGSSLAADNHLWGQPLLHAKLAILALIFVLTALHTKVPYARALSIAIFVLSLALVILGVKLSEV